VKWGGPSGVFLVRKQLKWAAVIIALIFIGLQFTTPSHTNPPFDEAQTLFIGFGFLGIAWVGGIGALSLWFVYFRRRPTM
jgi:hypothetical protein